MPGCNGDGLDIMIASVIVLNFDFEKLTILELECNTPGQLYRHTPVPVPVALQFVKPYIWWLALDT